MATLLHGMNEALDRMGSRELYTEIAHVFADSLPHTEAAIDAAMARQAWPEARRLAHSLKSNCAAMGAEELRSKAFSLEKACADADAETAVSLFGSLRKELCALREELRAL